MKPKGVTTQVKALDEYVLMVLFVFLLKRVHVITVFVNIGRWFIAVEGLQGRSHVVYIEAFSFLHSFSFFQEQNGITPQMFKTLIGRGHPEFSTNRQQDAQEFFMHLLSILDRTEVCVNNCSTKIDA